MMSRKQLSSVAIVSALVVVAVVATIDATRSRGETAGRKRLCPRPAARTPTVRPSGCRGSRTLEPSPRTFAASSPTATAGTIAASTPYGCPRSTQRDGRNSAPAASSCRPSPGPAHSTAPFSGTRTGATRPSVARPSRDPDSARQAREGDRWLRAGLEGRRDADADSQGGGLERAVCPSRLSRQDECGRRLLSTAELTEAAHAVRFGSTGPLHLRSVMAIRVAWLGESRSAVLVRVRLRGRQRAVGPLTVLALYAGRRLLRATQYAGAFDLRVSPRRSYVGVIDASGQVAIVARSGGQLLRPGDLASRPRTPSRSLPTSAGPPSPRVGACTSCRPPTWKAAAGLGSSAFPSPWATSPGATRRARAGGWACSRAPPSRTGGRS
jgi:hypothetical protein